MMASFTAAVAIRIAVNVKNLPDQASILHTTEFTAKSPHLGIWPDLDRIRSCVSNRRDIGENEVSSREAKCLASTGSSAVNVRSVEPAISVNIGESAVRARSAATALGISTVAV
jgi:hypothetical protein